MQCKIVTTLFAAIFVCCLFEVETGLIDGLIGPTGLLNLKKLPVFKAANVGQCKNFTATGNLGNLPISSTVHGWSLTAVVQHCPRLFFKPYVVVAVQGQVNTGVYTTQTQQLINGVPVLSEQLITVIDPSEPGQSQAFLPTDFTNAVRTSMILADIENKGVLLATCIGNRAPLISALIFDYGLINATETVKSLVFSAYANQGPALPTVVLNTHNHANCPNGEKLCGS